MTTLPKIAFANILLGDKKIGTRVLSFDGVASVVQHLIAGDPSTLKEGRALGQFIADLAGSHLSDILPYLSCGDGKHTKNPDDYVARQHWSGKVMLCLKRSRAEVATQVRLIIDTKDAYLADPDVTKDTPEAAAERQRIIALNPDYVVVWIVAAAASTEMPGGTFLRNLAGANNEALKMTADEIRAQAVKSQAHDEVWGVVAD